jgi:hypothetical protein
MDYADRRLAGHPRLELLVRPVENYLRFRLDAPSVDERSRRPFLVPPPPPRRGPADVSPAVQVPPGAKVWRVSPSGPLTRIADAAAQAQSGDVVEIEAGDYRGDVALWNQKRLVIRGVNGAARIYADGRDMEGKATWVIRDGDFEISNIDFIGSKVGDGNGAGIRFEGGKLRVRDCLFWGNQMGLLSSDMPEGRKATLVIEGSEFAYSHVDGRWGHNLYVGRLDELTVTHSYFHHAGVGHLLKSRARLNNILYNRLTDESGGRASYELDLPNGGIARVVGNIIQQQRGTEHGVLVAFGSEGYVWPVNRLMMSNNTLINDHPHGGTFVRAAPGSDEIILTNNLLVGPGRFKAEGAAMMKNNPRVEWEAFAMPSRQEYQLRNAPKHLAWQPVDAPEVSQILTPVAQYSHPRKLLPLQAPPAWVGADQRNIPSR